jgi:phage shock protein A
VQQLEQQVQAQSRQIDELREERSTDKKQMEDLRADMAKMQALIEQLASQRSHAHVVSGREGGAGEDESADDFYDDDE